MEPCGGSSPEPSTRRGATATPQGSSSPGPGAPFCSGADLTDPDNSAGRPGDPLLVQMRALGDLALRLHRLPKPTIAKVSGIAAGAGMSMALGCDLVVASTSARFS